MVITVFLKGGEEQMFLLPMIGAIIFYYWVLTRRSRFHGTGFFCMRDSYFKSTALDKAVRPVKDVKRGSK
jgi:hypothetical protein